MKNELTDNERQIAARIFEELVGLTVEQAKIILKAVLSGLDKSIVAKGGEFDE